MTTQSAYKSIKAKGKAIASYDDFLARWPVPYLTQIVTTSFGETHVIISGSPQKKPLVLLHGGATNSTMWLNNIEALSSKFQVFAIDIIGEPGKSAGTRPLYKSDGHARWLKEVFAALEIHEAALCGLSLGGMLAWKFALQYPESVSSLVLLSTSSLAPPSGNNRFSIMLRAILANLIPISFFAKNFLNCISASALQWPDWAVQGFIIQYQSYKFNFDRIPVISDQELSLLPSKTLILIGQDEILYDPIAVKSRINSVASSITIDLIPGAKHTISTDQSALVNERLLAFLD
jgi:pimeloyl-ACP methyl ester carboxylesterase